MSNYNNRAAYYSFIRERKRLDQRSKELEAQEIENQFQTKTNQLHEQQLQILNSQIELNGAHVELNQKQLEIDHQTKANQLYEQQLQIFNSQIELDGRHVGLNQKQLEVDHQTKKNQLHDRKRLLDQQESTNDSWKNFISTSLHEIALDMKRVELTQLRKNEEFNIKRLELETQLQKTQQAERNANSMKDAYKEEFDELDKQISWFNKDMNMQKQELEMKRQKYISEIKERKTANSLTLRKEIKQLNSEQNRLHKDQVKLMLEEGAQEELRDGVIYKNGKMIGVY